MKRYQEKQEEEEICLKDERNEMLRDKAGVTRIFCPYWYWLYPPFCFPFCTHWRSVISMG